MSDERRMVMIAYNEAVDDEVMEVVKNSGEANFTKVMDVYGKGMTSGTHLGNDIWPGKNNLVYVACTKEQAGKIIEGIRDLRKSIGREGVKAFAWTLNEVS